MNENLVLTHVRKALQLTQNGESSVSDIQEQLILAMLELSPQETSKPIEATQRHRQYREIQRVDGIKSEYTLAQISR